MSRLANKRSLASVLIALALLGAIASTQTWVRYSLDPAVSILTQLDVTGIEAQPLTFALFLAAGAAIFAALLVAGWLRMALFAGISIFGLLATVVSAQILNSETSAGRTQLAETLGLSDVPSLEAAMLNITLTPWLFVSLVMGILLAVISSMAIVASKSWQTGDRRFARTGTERGAPSQSASASRQEGANPADRIDDWDALTEGSDPTF